MYEYIAEIPHTTNTTAIIAPVFGKPVFASVAVFDTFLFVFDSFAFLTELLALLALFVVNEPFTILLFTLLFALLFASAFVFGVLFPSVALFEVLFVVSIVVNNPSSAAKTFPEHTIVKTNPKNIIDTFLNIFKFFILHSLLTNLYLTSSF